MNEAKRNECTAPPSCSAFVRAGDAGGNDERFVRTVSDNVWVSVLHRLTGFGWWEWETAICTREPRTCNIVMGDRRTELEHLPEEEVLAWYEAHKAEKNSMEAVLDALKPNSPLCVVTHSKTQEVQRHVAREVVGEREGDGAQP